MTNTRSIPAASTMSRLAGCLLAILTMAAAYDVSVARAQTTTTDKALVYTTCKQGMVNICGEEPPHVECTRSWKIDLGWVTQTFGIGISEVKCETVGKMTLYKDFYAKAGTTGFCTTYPGFPTDMTSVSPIRPEDEPLAEEGTC